MCIICIQAKARTVSSGETMKSKRKTKNERNPTEPRKGRKRTRKEEEPGGRTNLESSTGEASLLVGYTHEARSWPFFRFRYMSIRRGYICRQFRIDERRTAASGVGGKDARRKPVYIWKQACSIECGGRRARGGWRNGTVGMSKRVRETNLQAARNRCSYSDVYHVEWATWVVALAFSPGRPRSSPLRPRELGEGVWQGRAGLLEGVQRR